MSLKQALRTHRLPIYSALLLAALAACDEPDCGPPDVFSGSDTVPSSESTVEAVMRTLKEAQELQLTWNHRDDVEGFPDLPYEGNETLLVALEPETDQFVRQHSYDSIDERCTSSSVHVKVAVHLWTESGSLDQRRETLLALRSDRLTIEVFLYELQGAIRVYETQVEDGEQYDEVETRLTIIYDLNGTLQVVDATMEGVTESEAGGERRWFRDLFYAVPFDMPRSRSRLEAHQMRMSD